MLNICFNSSESTILKLGLSHEKLSNEKFIYSYEDLDLGRIHPNDFYTAREQLIYKSFASCSEARKRAMIEEARKRQNCIIETAKRKKELRIWCANNPASQCGLFYTVYSLKGIDCRIVIVNMPDNIGCLPPGHDRSWMEAKPEDILPCLFLQREISESERQNYEQMWETLANENAELRVNLNGRITSVSVDYFDDEILSYAPINVDFKLANLVGLALQCPHCLSTSFIEDRIETMITQGRITLKNRSEKSDYNGFTVIRVEQHKP